MAVGILAHTVGKLPLKQLTAKLAEYDLDFVQLALAKAISDLDSSLGKLSPGLANHIGEQFHKQGIRIGALGCYIDPIHPDPEQRRYEINRFKEHLRLARDFGTSIVATETGEFTTYQSQDPERYREIGWSVFKSTMEELAEEADKWGAMIGLEPVCVHTLSTPKLMSQILAEIPSSHLGVVFDPCNLLHQTNFAQRDEIIDESFRLFGDRIVLSHLRDVQYREDGRPKSVQLGAGAFDIAAYLAKLHQQKPFVDISIEGITQEQIHGSLQYVRNIPVL